jgi:hypothetical protein
MAITAGQFRWLQGRAHGRPANARYLPSGTRLLLHTMGIRLGEPCDNMTDVLIRAMDAYAARQGWTCSGWTATRGADGVETFECPNCAHAHDECECADGICSCGNLFEDHSRCESCERCSECCDCLRCGSCSEVVDDTCSSCEHCSSCCECTRADCGCRGRGLCVCETCDRCENCCGGHEEEATDVERVKRPLRFRPDVNTRVDAKRRYIGVEIEIAKAETADAINEAVRVTYASVVEDGSLPSTGFELVTQPARGAGFDRDMATIGKALRDDDASVTEKCGLHIHIDARDLGPWGLYRLVQTYARVEEALYAMVPAGRREGTYAQPCGRKLVAALGTPKSTQDLKARLFDVLYPGVTGKSLVRMKDSKYQSCRYNALNLHAWTLYRTVEFRHHSGSANAAKISAWARICEAIVEFSVQATKDERAAFEAKTDGAALQYVAHWFDPTDSLNDFIEQRTAKFAGRTNANHEQGE